MTNRLEVVTPALLLNLGCSDAHMKGYVNVDVCEPADFVCDLNVYPWIWRDSEVHGIKAWDIFEHLPDKRATMNEAYRILRPGGTLDLFVPTTDGRGAFQDPTHRSFWTPNDLFYFCEEFAEWQRFHVAYGISAHFRLKGAPEHREYPNKVWKLRAILEAVK